MIKTHLIEIFPLSRYQIGIEASLLMGVGIKNLGFGFILILIIKTLKGVLKQI
ncbi:hypothetical protein HpBT228_00650 [Helicobacter pylori]